MPYTEQEIRERTEARYTEIPIPCLHCKHLISVGSQFGPDGWTCAAFPDQILYAILTRREPHTTPLSIQEGDEVFDPKIYTEEGTGKEWHYTADGGWVFVEE